jgi:CHAT domain-containing protein
VDADGRYLVERLSIGYLASANDLLRNASEPGVGSLVVGGVDYDATGAGEGSPVAVASTRSAPRGGLEAFAFLPGPAEEAAAVVARLGGDTVHLAGAEATEERIRQMAPGRRLIHLATHGFFATGEVRSALAAEPDGGELLGGAATVRDGINPMLLSGVVLAGANSPEGDGLDDGVLTAEEVVGLDLRGAELVTLSACETGLGEVEQGEGVMGLRRAFALAGARSLVFSLWQVPDAETRRLMTAFYDRIAAAPGEPLTESFRASQLLLVEELRAERGDAPPLFWAAFVVSGR